MNGYHNGLGQSKPKFLQVPGYVRIKQGDEKGLLDTIATVEPVSVAYNEQTKAFLFYKKGILDVPNCGNSPTTKALIVGYGGENKKKFWIVKLAFGTEWVEKGYIRIARGKNMCGIADWVSYPYTGA